MATWLWVVAAAALCVLLWLALSWLRPAERRQVRLNLLRGRTSSKTDPRQDADTKPGASTTIAGWFPDSVKVRMQRSIDAAGRPPGYTVETMMLVKVAGLIVGVVGGVLLWRLQPNLLTLIVAAALSVGGFFVADLLVVSRAMERRQAIARDLPELLDQMVIAVSAGLGFDAAMDYVSKHSPGPLSSEMGRAVRDIRTGMGRRDAYLAMAERCQVDEVSKFVRAVNRANDHGVSVSDVLNQQATVMRTARRQRAEAQAAKIPAKVTLPVMLLIMPVLITLVTAPAGIKLFHVLTKQ